MAGALFEPSFAAAHPAGLLRRPVTRTVVLSVAATSIAHMFEISLPDPTELCRSDDGALVAAIEDCARVEAAASARRLSAIAELTGRRTGADQRADWACDFWDCAAAEVAAALTISHGKASGQMHLSLALNRLPQVAALFLAGHLGARLFSIIAWRTYLVRDPHALSLLDAALAEHAGAWGPLSAPKLEKAIDSWIDRYDPGALRRSRISARTRDLCIGDPDEDAGTAALWGRLYATDAAMLDRRLTEMAHGVCEDDPRTLAQRRADALGRGWPPGVAMYGYAAASASASRLIPFAAPPKTTNSAGVVAQAVASVSWPNPNDWWLVRLLGSITPTERTTIVRLLGQSYLATGMARFLTSIAQQLTFGPGGTTAGSGGAWYPTPQFAGLGAGPAVSASLARAEPVGRLSVPPSWAVAAPAFAEKPEAGTPMSVIGEASSCGQGGLLRGIPLARAGRRTGAFAHRYGFRHSVITRSPSAG